jgi:hypothetical protein
MGDSEHLHDLLLCNRTPHRVHSEIFSWLRRIPQSASMHLFLWICGSSSILGMLDETQRLERHSGSQPLALGSIEREKSLSVDHTLIALAVSWRLLRSFNTPCSRTIFVWVSHASIHVEAEDQASLALFGFTPQASRAQARALGRLRCNPTSNHIVSLLCTVRYSAAVCNRWLSMID